MRIATWNVNSLNVRRGHVLDWLERDPVDILALQETKLPDERFPEDAFREAGYHAVYAGQRTYNGVAVLARGEPPQDVETELPGLDDPQRRVLATTVHGVRIVNLYVPNGEAVGTEKYRYKLDWLEHCRSYVRNALGHHHHVAVVGDFNIAPAAEDVHDPDLWDGHVLFSEPEREALRALIDEGLTDTFRLFDQPAETFSWWDYRMNAFRRNRGLRIDHVLTSPALTERCRSCSVDPEPRRWQRPSDHAPVIAEFDPE